MKFTFRTSYTSLLLFSLFAIGGCCSRVDSTPPPPDHVKGWQEFQQAGIPAMGEFLLKKGASVENPKVGVELRETIKGRNCRGSESVGPRAILRFYRVPDKQIILELEFSQGNTRLINFNRSLVEEYGVDTISIRAINTKDEWVWFELWK